MTRKEVAVKYPVQKIDSAANWQLHSSASECEDLIVSKSLKWNKG